MPRERTVSSRLLCIEPPGNGRSSAAGSGVRAASRHHAACLQSGRRRVGTGVSMLHADRTSPRVRLETTRTTIAAIAAPSEPQTNQATAAQKTAGTRAIARTREARRLTPSRLGVLTRWVVRDQGGTLSRLVLNYAHCRPLLSEGGTFALGSPVPTDRPVTDFRYRRRSGPRSRWRGTDVRGACHQAAVSRPKPESGG